MFVIVLVEEQPPNEEVTVSPTLYDPGLAKQ
jgi:hypothetical protein